MQVHTAQTTGWLHYAIPIAIGMIVLAIRARRMTQLRPLNVDRLWIVPALYGCVVAALIWSRPPTGLGWAWTLAGLVAGVALGWQRGKTMQIHVDPDTHELGQRASIAGLAFLLVLVAVKMATRAEGRALHLDVALLTDVLAALAWGMIACQRLEMFLRAQRLLTAARAARPAARPAAT